MTSARPPDPERTLPPPAGTGLVAANLDADHHFALALGLTRDIRVPTKAARARAAVLSRLLGVLAGPGDWLLGFAALADGRPLWPGQPLPVVDAGWIDDALASGHANVPILPWAETRVTAALREALRAADDGRPPPPHRPVGHAVVDALWALEPADPDTVAALNHRRCALGIARTLDVALPGAALVRSVRDVTSRLGRSGAGRVGAARVGAATCVVKAACSSAGRDRVWVASDGTMGDDERARLERLFARHGEAVLEPWLDRTADFGVVGYVDADGRPRTVGLHRQRVDARGGFKGIDVPLDARIDDDRLTPQLGLRAGEAAALRQVHLRVGEAIAAAGYRGGYGIDAWHWRDGAGRTHLQPLGELNARLSMGLLGRVLADRAVAAVGPARGAAAVDATGVMRVVTEEG